ncbi:hypothetical protein KI387_004538 [Taxus chinensis]|uniref:Uncharacterized protein n=1 Tax=Taxus chinensis TaxID=29808 RepID=A0AA38GPI8_TAXCH|nr:hypothetical protein KI387_004538 [Taxus chinensis]
MGANIGKDVVLDSIDITDPSLVSIADEAVVSEGATLESHQVKNGMLVLGPVRIGSRASIGPFAFLQMGTVLASEAVVPALHRTEIGQYFVKTTPHSEPKGDDRDANMATSTTHIWQLLGIYTVAMVSTLSAAIVYPLFTGLAKSMQVPWMWT